MVGDKTMSLMKKKGQGGEFMKMYLAVYPYEVEFLNNVDYATSFYFEKSNPTSIQTTNWSAKWRASFPQGKKTQNCPSTTSTTSSTSDSTLPVMLSTSGVSIEEKKIMKSF